MRKFQRLNVATTLLKLKRGASKSSFSIASNFSRETSPTLSLLQQHSVISSTSEKVLLSVSSPTVRHAKSFTVALVGRPNVGKSSLFNRLVQQRLAIVNPLAGTTRDWKEADGRLGSLEFVVMDTGGLEDRGGKGSLEDKMLHHTERAIAYADCVLFIVDARAGVTEDDARFVRWVKKLRTNSKEDKQSKSIGVHLVANKAEKWLMNAATGSDDPEWQRFLRDCYSLRLGDPIPLAAEQGEGMLSLYDVLEPYGIATSDEVIALEKSIEPFTKIDVISENNKNVAVDEDDEKEPRYTSGRLRKLSLEALSSEQRQRVIARQARAEGPVQLAIVGRPNVGKSTLVNQIVGEDRLLTGPMPGLTRDSTSLSIDITVDASKLPTASAATGASPSVVSGGTRKVQVIDTAGMRRAGAMDLSTPLEGVAVGAAKKALMNAHVVALIVDASGGNAKGLTNEPISFKKGKSVKKLMHDGIFNKKSTSPPLETGKARSTRLEGLQGGVFGMTLQDLSIMQQVMEEGRGLVIVLNKMDATPNSEGIIELVKRQIASAPEGKGAEIVPVSALRGKGLDELMPAVLRTYDRWNRRISTGRLNQWLNLVTRHHPPPTVTRLPSVAKEGSQPSKAKRSETNNLPPLRLKLKYITQINSRPPTFALFANRKDLPESYSRYLKRSISEEFDFGGVPVRLLLRAAENPYRPLQTFSRKKFSVSKWPKRNSSSRTVPNLQAKGSSVTSAMGPLIEKTEKPSRTVFGSQRSPSEEASLFVKAARAKKQGGSWRPFSRKDKRTLEAAGKVKAARRRNRRNV
jgi:GTP-binding protein